MSTPEAATEIVADVAEEVAEQATHVAEVSRGLSGRDVGLVFGGLLVGTGLGATAGYIFAQRRLETKYNELAATEIAEMDEHFRAREAARTAQQEKGDLESIVKARGYVPEEADDEDEEEPEQSASPPMAVTPPSAVVERAEDMRDEEAETPPPAEEDPEPEVRNIFRDRRPSEDDWDWHKERSQRSPLRPYVIHVDERHDHEAYDMVTFTYYEADDVVCNERDEVQSEEERERIIGEANLEKFGHGSNDPTTVYIRNDQLEMDIEVNHSTKSFAEEVHGLEPEIRHSDRRRRRSAIDDD